MKVIKVTNVVGASPNFIKVAPLMKEMRRYPQVLPVLIHTGQHYDATMSEQFFVELEISSPDFNLGVGSGAHAAQTAGGSSRSSRRRRLPTDREHPFKTGRHQGCSNP